MIFINCFGYLGPWTLNNRSAFYGAVQKLKNKPFFKSLKIPSTTYHGKLQAPNPTKDIAVMTQNVPKIVVPIIVRIEPGLAIIVAPKDMANAFCGIKGIVNMTKLFKIPLCRRDFFAGFAVKMASK